MAIVLILHDLTGSEVQRRPTASGYKSPLIWVCIYAASITLKVTRPLQNTICTKMTIKDFTSILF